VLVWNLVGKNFLESQKLNKKYIG